MYFLRSMGSQALHSNNCFSSTFCVVFFQVQYYSCDNVFTSDQKQRQSFMFILILLLTYFCFDAVVGNNI